MSSQAPPADERVHVAIVGGGIGGLTAALFLRAAGVRVRVYEQGTRSDEAGAGLVVTPNAVRLLRRLGLAGRLGDRAVRLEAGWEFRRWATGDVLFSQEMGDLCVRMFGEPSYVAHRADLMDLLRDAVPSDLVRPGQRCIAVEEHGDTVRLSFTDPDGAPRTVRADAVIGADGIHSVIREAVTASDPPEFSGDCAFRCLIPAQDAPEFARRPVQTLWLGPGRHFVHYPVSAGRLINIVAIVPAGDWRLESWTSDGKVDDLAAEFAGWEPRVGRLIAAATGTKRWALYDRPPLERWTRGRMTLLGDAAHPMLPYFGQGANQAIEDGAVLARCLRDTTPGTLPGALARYETIRRPHASRVQVMSRGRRSHNHLPDGAEQRHRDATLAGQAPLDDNAWLYSYDADAEADRALAAEAS